MRSSVTSAPIDRQRRAARGVSVIELMVGLVVGLLVSLAATSTAQLFTAAQRQGIGTGGISANISSTVAAIKNDVANGGLGFFGDSAYLCTVLNLSAGAAVVADGAAFAPVRATRVGSNDVLDIVYGSEVAAGASVKTSQASDGTSATLKTLLPVSVGQAVLMASPNVGTPCVVRTVSATTVPTMEVKQKLTFAAAGTHNQGTFATTPTYDENSRIALLGTLQWSRYAIAGTDLTLTRPLDGSVVTLQRNVIAFRVEYGASIDAITPSLNSWEAPTGAFATINDANIGRVRALRIGMVVRSPQAEKAESDGVCRASTAKPQLFGDEVEPDVANWRCYRYRSVEVVAPMRNIIYGLRSS
jgi:type IV pilus assembly protein PilW